MPFSTADAGSKCRADIVRDRLSPARLRQKVVRDFQRDSGALLVPGGKTKQIERTALRIPQHFWLVCDRKKDRSKSLVEITANRIDARTNDATFVVTEQRRGCLHAVELVVPVISSKQDRKSFAP